MIQLLFLGAFIPERQKVAIPYAKDDDELWSQNEVSVPGVFCRKCGSNVLRDAYPHFKDEKGDDMPFYCLNHTHVGYDEVVKVEQ